MLRLRKSAGSLSAAEKAALVAAIKALKANGTWNNYVNEHRQAMAQATVLPGEPNDPSYRNVAHRGPAFGPWHREFLRRLELDLQAAVAGVTLPYWDWAADSLLPDPSTAPVWGNDLMGGNGDPGNSYLVGSGPFRYDPADPAGWVVVTGSGDPGPGLRRRFGAMAPAPPTPNDVNTALGITPYDSPPWTTGSNPSFRNQLEGWIGPGLHNRVHLWVGGSMLPGTSPNDPVFFLHHANVDRIWWRWQVANRSVGYVPAAAGPPGHNRGDPMSPWGGGSTPASVLYPHQLGYYYDTDPPMLLTMVTDRSEISMDEVASATAASPVTFPSALYVIADGLSPLDLGVDPAQPIATYAPIVGLQRAAGAVPDISVIPTALLYEDSTLPAGMLQRLTFVYSLQFTGQAAFSVGGVAVDQQAVTATATRLDWTTTGALSLIHQPNPYLLDGPVSWLSTDVRVFQIRAGDARFGLTMGTTPAAALTYIQQLLTSFDALPAAGHPFESISTDEAASALELASTVSGRAVFNFAVARVRFNGTALDAANVGVFFRLFRASTTSTEFHAATTYRSTAGAAPPVPLLGLAGGQVVTIPFFASARVDSSAAALTTQTDPPNRKTIVHGAGEVDTYFGCWVDINQPADPQFPLSPAPLDGSWGGGRQSIQSLVRDIHQCLVAEINFNPDPIADGATPGGSDKLSQRNLAIVDSDNPGDPASHVVTHSFEIRPDDVAAGAAPEDRFIKEGAQAPVSNDDLMIVWDSLPRATRVTLFVPGMDAFGAMRLAAERSGSAAVTALDAHTLDLRVEDVTYVPIPAGKQGSLAALLTLDLPSNVRHGERHRVVVRQISGRRHVVLGAFELLVRIGTASQLLAPETKRLRLLRGILAATPPADQWRLVVGKAVERARARVAALRRHAGSRDWDSGDKDSPERRRRRDRDG